MAWTTPRTWTNGEVVGETIMNTHVRDNLDFLKGPSFQQIVTGSAGPLLTTATTAVPMSTADLSITMTTYGGNVHLFFAGNISGNGGNINLDFAYDGTALGGGTTALGYIPGNLPRQMVTVNAWVTGLASGSHTFRPIWWASDGTFRLYLTNPYATFWAREG